MASKFAQEMPPPGGYGPFEWAKKAPKRGLSGVSMFGTFMVFTAYGIWSYSVRSKQMRYISLENNDARCAMEPLLFAEQQRLYMKQLRKNFEEECELMKDVPGWIPGTLWGEPVYYNRYDRWIEPSAMEYFAHCDPYDYYVRATEHMWH